jgi:hypothetical protein
MVADLAILKRSRLGPEAEMVAEIGSSRWHLRKQPDGAAFVNDRRARPAVRTQIKPAADPAPWAFQTDRTLATDPVPFAEHPYSKSGQASDTAPGYHPTGAGMSHG